MSALTGGDEDGAAMRGFLRQRGLIAFSVGGAMAEAVLLTFLAPAARPLAPQLTTLPPLAVYHDLRWLFTYNESWFTFAVGLVLLLIARAAVDTALIRLAWPSSATSMASNTGSNIRPHPRIAATFWSCMMLTALVGLLMSPVVTLAFGVALLPFSWPFLAALPVMLGIALSLSHGGVAGSWWRRLPPARTAVWLLASFLALSAAGAAISHLPTAAIIPVAALAGIFNARAWYGLTAAAAGEPATHTMRSQLLLIRALWVLRRRTSWIPIAPLAAVMVLALVVGLARMMFTGTVRLEQPARPTAAMVAAGVTPSKDVTTPSKLFPTTPTVAILVVEGFGSSCCTKASGLQRDEPGVLVRQFSYVGLTAAGLPTGHGTSASNLPLPLLGDRMAVQVQRLHEITHKPVDIVAESEGTLGVYAMLARHPGVPIGSVVMLSPIVSPGQDSYPTGGQDGQGFISGYALTTLNRLIGEMSPFGSAGAGALLGSVSEDGARYFDAVARSRHPGVRWLAIVPLADAVTLPACELPDNVLFVPAFHGGLLGNFNIRRTVTGFFAGRPVTGDQGLKRIAEILGAATAAWRMPYTGTPCYPAPLCEQI
jgi:hypothetical protein